MPQGIKHKQPQNNSYSVSATNKISLFGRVHFAYACSFRAVWECQRGFSWEERSCTRSLHKGEVAGSWDCSCAPTWRGGRKDWRQWICSTQTFYPTCILNALHTLTWEHPTRSTNDFRHHAMPWFNPLEAAPLHTHFPSCKVLHIFPIRRVCAAWLYTWQVKNWPFGIISLWS